MSVARESKIWAQYGYGICLELWWHYKRRDDVYMLNQMLRRLRRRQFNWKLWQCPLILFLNRSKTEFTQTDDYLYEINSNFAHRYRLIKCKQYWKLMFDFKENEIFVIVSIKTFNGMFESRLINLYNRWQIYTFKLYFFQETPNIIIRF